MQEERRLEILGILSIALSVFVLVSLGGYNPSEEPSISSNVQVTNPMGILGIFTAHVFIKLGFGYSSVIIPLLGLAWGWFLFSKKELDGIIQTSIYGLGTMIMASITVGVLSIKLATEGAVSYGLSGLIGGTVADFALSWLSIWGTSLFLIAGFLMIIRGYFNLDYYSPFILAKEKWITWRTQMVEEKEQFDKGEAKRLHTKDLKAKIDAQKERDDAEFAPPTPEPEGEISEQDETDVEPAIEESELESSEDETITSTPPLEEVHPEPENESESEPGSDPSMAEEGTESTDESEERLNIEEMAQTEEVDIDEVVERKKPRRNINFLHQNC